MSTLLPPEPSAITLDRVIPKGSRFLTALVDFPEILRVLASEDGGFTGAEFARGSSLFVSAMGLPQALPTPGAPDNQKAQEALAACDRLDDLLLVRVRNALQFEFPAQHQEILSDLTPATGIAAAANIKLVTERAQALSQPVEDPALQATRAAALKRLEEVGLTPTQLATYAQLAADALTVTTPVPGGFVLPTPSERHQARVAFYWWLKGWADIARRLIKNRNHLISLGLATRRIEAGREIIVDEPLDSAEPSA